MPTTRETDMSELPKRISIGQIWQLAAGTPATQLRQGRWRLGVLRHDGSYTVLRNDPQNYVLQMNDGRLAADYEGTYLYLEPAMLRQYGQLQT